MASAASDADANAGSTDLDLPIRHVSVKNIRETTTIQTVSSVKHICCWNPGIGYDIVDMELMSNVAAQISLVNRPGLQV